MITAKKKCTIILLLLISSAGINASAQTAEEINSARKMMPHKHAVKVRSRYLYATQNNTNEISWIFSGLFLAYKSFVSSQDRASCTFTPSCSEYGMLAVKKHGVLIGIISTFDRLTRCNGLSPELYEKDSKTGLFIDRL
jgi:putative membrane protein insertion efficiency factor